MELWGQMQNMMGTPEVHQLVSRVKTSMQEASAQFGQDIYQYIGDKAAKLADELAAHSINLQDT